MIERQVLNLKRLIDDLLDVSRMALNRIELQCKTMDLSIDHRAGRRGRSADHAGAGPRADWCRQSRARSGFWPTQSGSNR